MKVQAALLHTIGLALCVSSCDPGLPREQQVALQPALTDSPAKKQPPADTLSTDSLRLNEPGEPCVTCGRG